MKVLLTTFQHGKELLTVDTYSTARWMPKGFDCVELSFLAPFDPDTGIKMTTDMEPSVYMAKYLRILEANHMQIKEFVEFESESASIVALCCWCDKSRQQEYEHLYCHTILIGRYLEKHFPDLRVYYCKGRERNWFANIYLGDEQ